MRRGTLFCRVAVLVLLMAWPAAAADIGQAVLQAIFADPASGPLPLAPEAAAAMPEANIRATLGRMEERYGPFQSVRPAGSAYTVQLAAADLTVSLTLDQEQRIRGLLIQRVTPRGTTLAAFADLVAALSGRTSVLVTRDGEDLYTHNAEMPLAVGSAFKLVVLRAAMEAVAAGHLTWEQVVHLDAARRSLPTGFLQTWPAGTPVTVATLVDAMISVSDNTAADTLVHLLGQNALDALSPRNAPFLSTRTMFALRSGTRADAVRDWRDLAVEDRRSLASGAETLPLPDPAALQPVGAGGAEWYLSARELCALLAQTRDAPAFQINPGPALRDDWRSIAFKGGGDLGVLDLSVLAVSQDNHAVCVSVTWNDPGASQARLAGPVGGLLHALAHDGAGPAPR